MGVVFTNKKEIVSSPFENNGKIMEFSWKLFGNVESQITEATMSKKQKFLFSTYSSA